MPRRTVLIAVLALFSAAAATAAERPARPRVIVLGFDGADVDLTRKWMEEGKLPNLKRVAEQGTFRPLQTANPAQSPVSWAVFETASNPGKTNLGDFVRRGFSPSSGRPIPQLAGVKRGEEPVPADRAGEVYPLTRFERIVVPLALPGPRRAALAVLGLLVFLLTAVLTRRIFALPVWLALASGLLLAGTGGAAAHRYLSGLPEKYPTLEKEMRGEPFWEVLGRAGVRVTGLQVPAAFPCESWEGARILAGLFTPDISGGPGAWYIYTNDEWAIGEESTGSGGTVFKIYEDRDGVYRTTLRGPDDFVDEYRFRDRVAELERRLAEPGLPDDERARTQEELERVRAEERAWRDSGRKVTVPFEIEPDFENGKVRLTVDGETQTVEEGGWSDYFHAEFRMTPAVSIGGLVRVFVQECGADELGENRLRLFVPPISVSPEDPPFWFPLSTPRAFASELYDAIGPYDTLGWACYTNALKDEELPDEAFLQGLEHVSRWRTKMLMEELERDDWDVLFHVESVTDRAGHMLYRYIDPQHPQYDAKDSEGNLLRDKQVTAYGRTFPLRDGILETYKEMDRIVGLVLDKIDSGALGPDVKLMIVSDHGFEPFRYGVNLNVWLNRMGYLKLKGEVEAEKEGPEKVAEIRRRAQQDYLGFVDWEHTQAYSLGLGKIYINLKGREPLGIVPQERYEALKDEIIEKLRAFRDPIEGHGNAQVVLEAYDAFDIYDGPPEHITDFGDIVLGFGHGYRVSWQTSLGGYERDTYDTFGIADNRQPWSGDHCGNDPSIVKGIFFANFPLADPDFEPSLLNVAPTVLDLLGVERPAEWDGEPMPR